MITRQKLRDALGVLVLVLGVAAVGVSDAAPAVARPARCVQPVVGGAANVEQCRVWREEFEGAVGSRPDAERWRVETGGLGWGDGTQLQAYTDDPSNVALDGRGALVLTARQEAGAGGAGYTSARVSTCGGFAFLHGRAEARIKLPAGQGLWPAFWTVGAEGPWPQHGEIDVVEGLNDPDRVLFNLHQPRSDGSDWTALESSPVAAHGSWADDFHVYAVEWSSDAVSWSVDGAIYARVDRDETPADGQWVLDRSPQVLVLNLAVGGWPGDPDATTSFPASMIVDYVRVDAAPIETPLTVSGPCAAPSSPEAPS